MQGHRNQSLAITGNCTVKSLSQVNHTHLRTDFSFWSLLILGKRLFTSYTVEQNPFNFQSTFIYNHFTPNVLFPEIFFHINSSFKIFSFFFYFFSSSLLMDGNKNPSPALFCSVKQASLFLITCDWKDASLPIIILFTQGSQFQLDSSLLYWSDQNCISYLKLHYTQGSMKLSMWTAENTLLDTP